MTWENFMVGILSGIVSSSIVAIVLYIYEKRREMKLLYEQDIRLLSEYVRQLTHEIYAAIRTKSYNELGRILAKYPNLDYLKAKKLVSQKLVGEINEITITVVDLNNAIITGEVRKLNLDLVASNLLANMFNILVLHKNERKL